MGKAVIKSEQHILLNIHRNLAMIGIIIKQDIPVNTEKSDVIKGKPDDGFTNLHPV